MAGTLFDRIVCGVDGSPESLEAVRQSTVLLEPDGTLVLVAAVDPERAIRFQVAPTPWHAARHALEEIESLDEAAVAALDRARELASLGERATTREMGGKPVTCLLEAVAAERAALLAVGTHGLGRAAGILLGSVATQVLHRAPCSVLVARGASPGPWAPRVIVLGDDGSASAAEARRVCDALAARFDAAVDLVSVAEGRPGHALVQAAGAADLLVVGRRGTRPALGLGSVSEHVAHNAGCSVLVVHEAPAADGA